MNVWSCVPNAFSQATGINFDEIIRLIGHDGSEIMDASLPEPYGRRGFHVQEVIEALWTLGWSVTEFDCFLYQVSMGKPRRREKRDVTRFMTGHPGVLTGDFDGKSHAVYWDGVHVSGSFLEARIASFYAVKKWGV